MARGIAAQSGRAPAGYSRVVTVVVPRDRVALGLELPVLPGKPLPNPVVRAMELQKALAVQGKVAVYRLDGMLDDDLVAQDEVEALVPGLATALQVNPQRDIIPAVDLECG